MLNLDKFLGQMDTLMLILHCSICQYVNVLEGGTIQIQIAVN